MHAGRARLYYVVRTELRIKEVSVPFVLIPEFFVSNFKKGKILKQWH